MCEMDLFTSFFLIFNSEAVSVSICNAKNGLCGDSQILLAPHQHNTREENKKIKEGEVNFIACHRKSYFVIFNTKLPIIMVYKNHISF